MAETKAETKGGPEAPRQSPGQAPPSGEEGYNALSVVKVKVLAGSLKVGQRVYVKGDVIDVHPEQARRFVNLNVAEQQGGPPILPRQVGRLTSADAARAGAERATSQQGTPQRAGRSQAGQSQGQGKDPKDK